MRLYTTLLLASLLTTYSVTLLATEQTTESDLNWELKGQLAALNDPHDEVFITALWNEALSGSTHSYGALLPKFGPKMGELLKNQDRDVQQAAVMALGDMGEHAASQIPKLVELLKNKDQVFFSRIAAADALGKMGKHAASQAPEIGELLKDPDDDVRQAVAVALGVIKTGHSL